MNAAFIVTGGLGDFLLSSPAIVHWHLKGHVAHVHVNSHNELFDFVKKSTLFKAFKCPKRLSVLKEPENPLNLGTAYLDTLFREYDRVYALCPDGLGQMPFAFPWFDYVSNYEDFTLTKMPILHSNDKPEAINPDKKNVLIHATSVTLEKNIPFPTLQRLVDLFGQTDYNLIITRTSEWQGTPIPFFVNGKFVDVVNQPITELVKLVAHADYVISIDSAVSHLAYHLSRPRLNLAYNQNPFHLVRYHTNIAQELSIHNSAEQIFNRVMLNMRDPITQKIPASVNIPYQTSTKQLLFKQYYD